MDNVKPKTDAEIAYIEAYWAYKAASANYARYKIDDATFIAARDAFMKASAAKARDSAYYRIPTG